jgi:hypothetical protein
MKVIPLLHNFELPRTAYPPVGALLILSDYSIFFRIRLLKEALS